MTAPNSIPGDDRKALEALFHLAVSQHQAGNLDEAATLYRRVVASSPGHAPAHHNLGAIAFQNGDLTTALAHYRTAASLRPEREQGWLSCADTALAANRFAEAAELVRAAMAAGHDTPAVRAIADRIDRAAAAAAGERPRATADEYGKDLLDLIDRRAFDQAEQLGRQAVAQFPNFGLGWKLLGVAIQIQGGNALAALRRATELLPEDPDTHLNLGAARLAGNEAAGAEACFRAAIRLAPEIPEAHANLALALDRQGRAAEVAECYLQLARLQPGEPAHLLRLAVAYEDAGDLAAADAAYRRAAALGPLPENSLIQHGSVLTGLDDIAGAIERFRAALALRPDNPESHRLLADARLKGGEAVAAEASYREALRLKPDHFAARLNLGTCLNRQFRLEEAAEAFRAALATGSPSRPNAALAAANLAATLYRLGRLDDAIASGRRAVELDQFSATAYLNLSAALFDAGRIEEALEACRRGLDLRPDFPAARRNLGDILIERGDVAEGIAQYRRGMADPEADPGIRQSFLFAQNYVVADRALRQEQFTEASRFGEQVRALAKPFSHGPGLRAPDRRLRVGLVSGDLFGHPVGLFLEGALRAFDDDSIEWFAYYNHFVEDAHTARLKARIANWRNILNRPDDEVAKTIHEDRIDILVDLAGHGSRNRLPLFAWRAAPVQATWLGYFATTGLAEIDYFITDARVLPIGEEAGFVEKPARLPDCFLCFPPPQIDLPPGSAPSEISGSPTFGCFNNIAKLNDEVIASWAKILRALPDSRLLLKSRQLGDATVRSTMAARFGRLGVAPERVLLEGPSPRDEYFAAYRRVDLALDPFPYTGGTTTIEGLWMGVPALTLESPSLIGRQGASILETAGLGDWVAKDPADYQQKAVAFARDVDMLARMRAGLRERLLASPLCNSRRYGRALSQTLHDLWKNHCEGKAPSQHGD